MWVWIVGEQGLGLVACAACVPAVQDAPGKRSMRAHLQATEVQRVLEEDRIISGAQGGDHCQVQVRCHHNVCAPRLHGGLQLGPSGYKRSLCRLADHRCGEEGTRDGKWCEQSLPAHGAAMH